MENAAILNAQLVEQTGGRKATHGTLKTESTYDAKCAPAWYEDWEALNMLRTGARGTRLLRVYKANKGCQGAECEK